jgi:hypothetical protein
LPGLKQITPNRMVPPSKAETAYNSGLTAVLSNFRLNPEFYVKLWLKILLLRREAHCRRDPLKLQRCSPKKKPSASICRPSPLRHRRSNCRPWLLEPRRRPRPAQPPRWQLPLPPLLRLPNLLHLLLFRRQRQPRRLVLPPLLLSRQKRLLPPQCLLPVLLMRVEYQVWTRAWP